MAASASITFSGSSAGINISSSVTKTGGSCVAIDEAIPANQTDLLFNISFDKDRLNMVMLLATESMTIETNNGSAPGDTISLTANEPLTWYTGQTETTNPFASADVTAFYITNTTAGQLTGFILHDPTA